LVGSGYQKIFASYWDHTHSILEVREETITSLWTNPCEEEKKM
jgi:hypothetical protein